MDLHSQTSLAFNRNWTEEDSGLPTGLFITVTQLRLLKHFFDNVLLENGAVRWLVMLAEPGANLSYQFNLRYILSKLYTALDWHCH